jgi:hypothetical protein
VPISPAKVVAMTYFTLGDVVDPATFPEIADAVE